MSPFQWIKLDMCLHICSNRCLIKKTPLLSLKVISASLMDMLSGEGKMGRRNGTNNHYTIMNTEDRRSTSRGEMELMSHTESASASKTFWQHCFIPRP